MQLQQEIEKLISENASDFEVSKAIKAQYKLYLSSLEETFAQNHGKNFLVKHTKAIDGFLKVIYKYIIRKHFEDYSPMHNALPIALVALGSYGREQLCVYSDIDLMLVYKDIRGYNTQDILESVLSMAWDAGLKLGHRVHEVSDLLQASRDDQTIKTAIIESRFIVGSKFIWIETQNVLRVIQHDDQKAFINTKLQEYHDRHRKKDISMRADIKNGAGGLRDLNAVYWIANVLHQASRVRDLVPSIISEEEYAKMMRSIDYLFRLRAALHLVAGKKQDTLILELIPDVAKLFHLSQRKVAEKTYKALVEVETLSAIFLMHLTTSLYPQPSQDIIMIDETLFIHHDRLYARPNPNPTQDILSVVTSLLVHIDAIENYDISFIDYIYRCTFSAKNSPIHHTLIKELLYHDRLYALCMSFYRANILTKLFPSLLKVKYLPQFDGYHKYPVDIHSIHTLRALENISDSNVQSVYDTFNKEEKALLRLCTFLHDSGKGRRKNHSELGAIIVKNFAKELGFSKEHIAYADILVRYHTLMSNLSAREDIYNQKIIYTFNAKIKKPIVLKLLYVLTFADIESVGEGTYSNFNANLLHELYNLSLYAFSHNKMISEAAIRIKREQQLQKHAAFKALKKSTQKKILSIQSNLLFFKYLPAEITHLARWIETQTQPHEVVITHNNTLCLTILSKDPLNVGYLLGKLSHLDISTMDIFSITSGLKYFKISFLEEITAHEISHIQKIVEDSFDMQRKTHLPQLSVNTRDIQIDCEHSNSYAKMKVNCQDQKGLIANIIAIFDDMGIDIASAKIQTIKNRARNLFLIERNGRFCVSQDIIVQKITQQG